MKKVHPEQLDLFGPPGEITRLFEPQEEIQETRIAMGGKKRTVAAKEIRASMRSSKSNPKLQGELEAISAPPKGPPRGSGKNGGGGSGEEKRSLKEITRERYLNYAFSVITSRALPDVRDGLKPVQRRILFAMYHDEHLYPDAKHRKSAKVVGSVIGKYHPHGDTAIYDAMVRMAQDFSLRAPLVDGSGNFGSLDGDAPAAYRYTEARLAKPAMELLKELRQDTVLFRQNFDGTADEPVVMPARFPNLLVNGCTGIAVGMATNIPPHNLSEIVKALIALIGDRTLTTINLLKYIKGPDFPTGGQMLNTKVELRQIYERGQGAIRVRAEYKVEENQRGGHNIIVKSIPYGVTKSTIVERIADAIITRKLPQLIDVRDESTTDVRIVLETKKDSDPQMVMAYLFKNTPLQLNFNVNLTCLIPTNNPEVGQPVRVGIKDLLEHFLNFRFEVTRRRFEFELAALKKRIHLLNGFAIVFDCLDETIRIIRRSEGKADAATKLIKRYSLDKIQVEAILELKLYKLAKLEILVIREELKEKKAAAKKIETILRSKAKLWSIVKSELKEVAELYHSPRRTKTGGLSEVPEFDAAAYIVVEDFQVVLSVDGWIKRVREIKDPSKLRIREGDHIMAILPGSTKSNVVLFSNLGAAYVISINDIQATTGYGEPVQKYFKFRDGERVIAAMTLDPRAMIPETMLSISENGFGQRFSLQPYYVPTTKAGRKFARPAKGDKIVDVVACNKKDTVVCATQKGHVLLCKADSINQLENPGNGVTVIKVANDDILIGFISGSRRRDTLDVESEKKGGKKFQIFADPKKAKGRGGKGNQIVKRSRLRKSPLTEIEVIPLATNDGGKGVH